MIEFTLCGIQSLWFKMGFRVVDFCNYRLNHEVHKEIEKLKDMMKMKKKVLWILVLGRR